MLRSLLPLIALTVASLLCAPPASASPDNTAPAVIVWVTQNACDCTFSVSRTVVVQSSCISATLDEGSPDNTPKCDDGLSCVNLVTACDMQGSATPTTITIQIDWSCCTTDMYVCVNGAPKKVVHGDTDAYEFEVGGSTNLCNYQSSTSDSQSGEDTFQVKCGTTCNQSGGMKLNWTITEHCAGCPGTAPIGD